MIDFNKVKEFAGEETAVEAVMETAVATANLFDIAKVKRDFAPYLAKIDEMVKMAEAFKITDDKSASQATEMIAQSKRLFKQIEIERKTTIKEKSDFVDNVNGFVKLFTVKLKAIDGMIAREQVRYQNVIEMARREAERKAQEATRKLQEKINKDAAKKHIEPVQLIVPAVLKADKIIRSETGASTSFRREWKVKVIDSALVDRLFCSPDMIKLQEAVDTGIREIAGCEVFEKMTPVTRS